MGRKDDVPVGGLITRKNGKIYEVVDRAGCSECAFVHKPGIWCSGMSCVPHYRVDSKNIIFKRRKDLETKEPSI